MGEAINLVENFKVENVIFNCGKFNELEQDLIKVLNKKKIPYYSCIKELNINDNKLYFLNNKDYGNENDILIFKEVTDEYSFDFNIVDRNLLTEINNMIDEMEQNWPYYNYNQAYARLVRFGGTLGLYNASEEEF